MAATTITGQQIRKELATEHGDWVFLGAATATGTTSYIVDTERLQGANLPSGAYDNCIVRITSGAAAGETTGVDYLDVDNGRLYLTPDISAALVLNDEYEIWLKGIDPYVVDRLRDNALDRWASTWRPVPLSIIVDGDFEMPNVTHWTAAGAATRSKVLSDFADEGATHWNLVVVNTNGAADYVESDSIPVQEGQRFYIEADVSSYVTSSSATAEAHIVAYDKSQSAAIALGGVRTTHNGKGWGKLSILITIPTGCTLISIRLVGNTTSSTQVWGGIAMHRIGASRVNLPARIRTLKRVATNYLLSNPSSSAAFQGESFKVRQFRSSERQQIGGRVVVWFNPKLGQEAVWYYERGYFARLQTNYYTAAGRAAGDTATTDAPLEYVTAILASLLAEFYMQKYGDDWKDDFVQAKARWNYWEGQFGPEPKIVEEVEEPIYIPQLKV